MTGPRTSPHARRPLAAMFLALVLSSPGASAAEPAADPDPDRDAAPETGDTRSDSAQADGTAATKRGDSPEVFVPSEDISEDFAVSFPVDI